MSFIVWVLGGIIVVLMMRLMADEVWDAKDRHDKKKEREIWHE